MKLHTSAALPPSSFAQLLGVLFCDALGSLGLIDCRGQYDLQHSLAHTSKAPSPCLKGHPESFSIVPRPYVKMDGRWGDDERPWQLRQDANIRRSDVWRG